MAAGNSGFTIAAALQDNVSKRAAEISKTLTALQKSAADAGDSSKVLADVNMSRITEGVKSLGSTTFDFAKSLERTISPMSVLTSATTLGSVLALGKAWGETATNLRNVGYSLSTPVGSLSALRQGLKLAHVDAGAADTGLHSLMDSMVLIKNGGPGAAAAASVFNWAGIKTTNAAGELRPVLDVLDDVADRVKAIREPHAQETFLDKVLGGHDMLPALKDGAAGLHKLEDQARKTGSVMTEQMSRDLGGLNNSLARLGESFEGVGLMIAEKFAPGLTKGANATATFLQNNTDLVASLSTLAGILGTLLTAEKALGWITGGAVGVGATTAGALALPLVLKGDTADNPEARIPHNPITSPNLFDRHGAIGDWIFRHTPASLGGGAGSTAGGSLDNATLIRARTFRDALLGANIPGMTPTLAAGFAGNSIQESNANPNSRPGDMGAAHGLMMWRDERLENFKRLFGHLPEQGNLDEAVKFTKWELEHTEADAWRNIRAAGGGSLGEAGAAVSKFYERPKDVLAEEQRRWVLAQQVGTDAPAAGAPTPLGTGRIDVHIHGAPPGTRATAQSTGNIDISPPRIGTSTMGLY